MCFFLVYGNNITLFFIEFRPQLVKMESNNLTVAQVHHFNKRDLSQKPEHEQLWQQTVHVVKNFHFYLCDASKLWCGPF